MAKARRFRVMDVDGQHWKEVNPLPGNIVLHAEMYLLRSDPAKSVLRVTSVYLDGTLIGGISLPWIAKSSTIISPTPRPLSALHSSSSLPETCSPATNNGSGKNRETFALLCADKALIGSGRAIMATETRCLPEVVCPYIVYRELIIGLSLYDRTLYH